MIRVQEVLFQPVPPRVRKGDGPAYRMSRRDAEAARDGLLATWRDHQAGCEQCQTAVGRAAAAGTRPVYEVCAQGCVPVMAAARIQSQIIRGWYPDRDQPASAGPGPVSVVQTALFT